MTFISRFLCALFVALLTVTAQAQITLITEVGEGAVHTGYTGTYGFVFITNQDITVRSLGFYDHGGDGLAQEHWVGIGSGSASDSWPFLNHEIVGQVTIPSGTAAHYEGGFRWVNLETPITLQAGVYYSLAGLMNTLSILCSSITTPMGRFSSRPWWRERPGDTESPVGEIRPTN